MNPELEKQVVSLVEAAKRTGSDVASFIQQQAPDVVEQLIRWKIIQGAVGVITGCAMLYAAWVLFWKVKAYVQADSYHRDVAWIPASIGIALLVGFGAASASLSLDQALQAAFAPKVFLLEYVAHLVK